MTPSQEPTGHEWWRTDRLAPADYALAREAHAPHTTLLHGRYYCPECGQVVDYPLIRKDGDDTVVDPHYKATRMTDSRTGHMCPGGHIDPEEDRAP